MRGKILFFAVCFLAGAIAVHAQKAREDLLYPVNPPRKVLPAAPQKFAAEIPGRAAAQSFAPATDAEDEYLAIYQKILQPERLEARGSGEAVQLQAEALAGLLGLQKSRPDFHPQIVAYRISKASRTLDRLLSRK